MANRGFDGNRMTVEFYQGLRKQNNDMFPGVKKAIEENRIRVVSPLETLTAESEVIKVSRKCTKEYIDIVISKKELVSLKQGKRVTKSLNGSEKWASISVVDGKIKAKIAKYKKEILKLKKLKGVTT